MEYKSLDELERVAEVIAFAQRPRRRRKLSKRARLERWAAAREARRGETLRSLVGTEHASPEERETMREDNSALTVAYRDPVLRAAGLASDRLGDAMRFFRLNHDDVHQIVCSCHQGRTMSARVAAARVRIAALHANSLRLPALRTCALAVYGIAGVALALVLL